MGEDALSNVSTFGGEDQFDMKSERNYVYHGSDWPEHEDLLIGNRDGLITLKFAIEEALEKGESHAEMGEFLGVRCVDTSFFHDQGHKNTLGLKIGFAVIGFAFVLAALILWLSKSA